MRAPMRFLPALCLLLLLPAMASAQSYAIDRGSMMIGGTAGFTSTGGDFSDERVTQLLINPSVHYFVTKGLSFGGDVLIRRISDGGGSSTSYGAGPGVMYYFGGSERPVYPYLSAGAQVLRFSEGETTLGYRAAAGAIVMLVDAVGLNGSLFYQASENDDVSSDTFGLALGIAAFIFE